jgi:hypothetical protein
MVIEEFRVLLVKEPFQPFVIETRDDRANPVRKSADVLIFDPYPMTMVVAVPKQGILVLAIASIESIGFEYELAASGE